MTGRKPEVWIVTPELNKRGATERSVAEKIERWDDFNIRVYTMRHEGVDLTRATVRMIPWIPGPHLLRYLWWILANRVVRAVDSIRGGGPDVLFSPGVNALDADVIGVHIVFSQLTNRIGNGDTARLSLRSIHRAIYWRVVSLLEGFAYRGTATLWAHSQATARTIEKLFGRPTETVPVVPFGVDSARFNPELVASRRTEERVKLGVEGGRVLLLIGNEPRVKGMHAAIKMMRLLPDDFILCLAGDLDDAALQREAAALGVGDRIRIWPYTQNVLRYYAAADVLIAPSLEDSFHQPTLEAMACGIPVVVSRKAGVSELLESEKHALILEDPTNVTELAEAATRAVLDEEMRGRLINEGLELTERMTWNAHAEQTAALLRNSLASPRFLLLATDAFGVGGIQWAVKSLVRVLSQSFGRDRVGIVSLLGANEGDSDGWVLSPRAQRNGTGPSFASKLTFASRALLSAARWRKRLAIVACHPHLAVVAAAAARISRCPYFVWCHGIEAWGPQPALRRMAMRNANGVFAGSRVTARRVEEMAGLKPGSVDVIPYPVRGPREKRESSRPPQPTILTVSRLDATETYKGIDTLLNSLPKVLAEIPDAELVVAGDGDDRPRLERVANDLGVEGHVTFEGRVSDQRLEELYSSSSVFALPSRFSFSPPQGEGFGLVYLEAALSGLPVVAGRGGGAEEVVVDGETGLLADAGDPSSVATAIVTILKDADLARKMSERGKANASRFSDDAFAAGFLTMASKKASRG